MDLSGHEEEIPIPINSSTYVGQSHGHGHGHGHSLLHDHPTPTPLSLHHHHHHHPHPNPPSTNGPPPPPPLSLPLSNPVINEEQQHSKKGGAVVKYRECLKNHAASIGGNATDGCGEFMPSGEEGTLEALKCSACNCHRNFHRKEVEGECDYFNNTNLHHHHHIKLLGGGRKLIGGHKGVLISSSSPDAAAAAAFGYNSNNNNNSLIPRPTPHNMIMPLGAMQTSESDEMEGTAGYPRPPMMKKRFRTKFSAEQKEKMLAFAEKAGWRLQKQEESVVQHFCQEIGVKRRVLKVWMHNNKHNFAKKNPLLPSTLDDNRINEMN